MSKAFTREDDAPEPPVVRRVSALPPGTKHLLTPDGAQKLRAELSHIQSTHTQLLATRGHPDASQQLAALDQRAALIEESLRTASVIAPPATSDDRVRFGATVTVRAEDGTETRHRIVGVDEVDFERGWVSWQSPIAKALLNQPVGQRVRVRLPSGERDWEITAVSYG